jgi:hypothetical protein
MAKGKYAARASLRREDADVRSELNGYQHHVKRLTAENATLKETLATERKLHAREVKQLKSQLDEGLSPEVLALRRELERQRERANHAAARSKADLELWRKLRQFTAALLHDVTGCTGLEAHEAIIAVLGDKESAQIIGQGAGADLDATADNEARATTLQRMRGFRSSRKVIDHLNALCRDAARSPMKSRRAQ